MRNVAHPAMSRLAIASWAISAGVVVLLWAFDWNRDVARGMVGMIILLTGAGIAREVRASHDGCIDKMLEALVRTKPRPAPHQQGHRPAA